MLKTIFRSVWAHKRRLVSTCVAIILGVAFMAGTFVLNGTVGSIFDDLFADIGKGVDAQIRGPELFEQSQFGGSFRDVLDQSLVEEVRAVPGVAAAEGSVTVVDATVIDAKGDAMGGFGPPVMVGSWDVDPQMSPYQVVEGRAPESDDEAVIDMGGLDKGEFELGDPVRIVTGNRDLELTLVGATRFGDADSAGGSVFVGTTLARAQEIAEEPEQVNTINVRADEGISSEQLVDSLRTADLADDLDIVTGVEAADEQADSLKSAMSFFTIMLTIFALIALFVGWFIISNTFAILVAQRTRELALLRAIGAARRQILTSVLGEAVVIGLFSGIIGLGAGIALAYAGFGGLRAAGVDLPSAGIIVPPSAIASSIAAGLFVTVIAAIGPAIRATRVPPIAALRDTAIDTSGASKIRTGFGILVLAAGVVLAAGAFTDDATNTEIARVGIGAALILASVLVLGPVLATPLAATLGAWLPKVKGITGTIARQNAMRSPRRTASTAAALIIGVALIVFITVFAQSATASIDRAIGTGFEGDYIVMPANQFGLASSPPEVVDQLRDVDGVEAVAPLAGTLASVQPENGRSDLNFVGSIDPERSRGVFAFTMEEGRLEDLAPGRWILARSTAREEGVGLGDRATITSTTGRKIEGEVVAITDDVMLSGWTITPGEIAELDPKAGVFMMGIDLADGVSVDSIRDTLRDTIADYPQLKLQDRDQFTEGIVSQITQLLLVVYVLLAVSIVISMIGIANTLSLSIHERTRELGLLRAMGMTRSQLRSSVRWEAVIVALIGTILGIGLGIGLSWLMVRVLASQGITDFSAPPVWMITTALIAAGLAVSASILPARRAARLDVLEAIGAE